MIGETTRVWRPTGPTIQYGQKNKGDAKDIGLMRIYIQNVRTGEFYDGNGEWSSDEGKAFAFPNGLAALNFCQTLPKHLQVIMRFETPCEGPSLRVTEKTLR